MEDRDYSFEEYEDICDFIDDLTDQEVLHLQETIDIVIAKKNDRKILPIHHDPNILH